MKILQMTASFGKLQNETLTLHDGLNVLTAPNESGKSTWAAFLLAMLYGVDSSERTTKTNLPAKAKYRPWSGAAMEGRLEVEWNGRRIAIERTGRARAPMSEFRAYDLETMQPVAGMTGENCGEMLLGVGRSVYERSAFLAQGGAAVTSDAALERRLASLVTSGDESVSFTDSRRRLNDWKNRCQHNKTGLLPQARAELAMAEDTLAQIHALHQADVALAAQREELLARQAELQDIAAELKAQEAARRLAQKREAQEAAEAAERRYASLSAECAALPSEQTLLELQRKLTQAWEAALPDALPARPQEPECPPVFSGLADDEILPKAQRDAAEYERLCAGKHRPYFPCLFFAALWLIAAVVFAVLRRTELAVCSAVLLLAALTAALLCRRANRARAERLDRAEAILKAYDFRAASEFVAFAAAWHEQLLVYRHRAEEYAARRAAYDERQRQLDAQRARLLGQVSMFAPQADNTAAAQRAVQSALERHAAAQEAGRQAQALRARYDAVSAALGDLTEAPRTTRDLSGFDARQVSMELLQMNTSLSSIRSQLDLSRGKAEALGDPARLQARCEELREQIRALEQRQAALELAMETLEQANDELQTRFAPQLAALAGQLLAQLTDARYDAVLLDRELHAEARQTGEPVTRQLLSLSGGTVDQVYLAVRLAICRLALGADVPIVLDDALVRFDDARVCAALALLRAEAGTRQILLFTCQGREQAMLEKM